MAGMKARAVKEKMKSAKSNLKLTFYCKGKQNSVNLGVYRLTTWLTCGEDLKHKTSTCNRLWQKLQTLDFALRHRRQVKPMVIPPLAHWACSKKRVSVLNLFAL